MYYGRRQSRFSPENSIESVALKSFDLLNYASQYGKDERDQAKTVDSESREGKKKPAGFSGRLYLIRAFSRAARLRRQ